MNEPIHEVIYSHYLVAISGAIVVQRFNTDKNVLSRVLANYKDNGMESEVVQKKNAAGVTPSSDLAIED